MAESNQMDMIVLLVTGGVFIVGLWSMIFAFMYGFQKRLDKIILLLQDLSGKHPSDGP
jgi:hypothetical protein